LKDKQYNEQKKNTKGQTNDPQHNQQSINHIYGVHSSLHSTIVVIYRKKLEDIEGVIKSRKWKETLLRKTNTFTEQHENIQKWGRDIQRQGNNF
jgi:Mg2+/Co2+ transporter CorB